MSYIAKAGRCDTLYDGDKARVYVADDASASTLAEQLALHLGCTVGQMRAQALLGLLKRLDEGWERGQHSQHGQQ
jgi:alpha-D-ribose 1-methylphosphonate 5-triphosphate synthase subunit PhnH